MELFANVRCLTTADAFGGGGEYKEKFTRGAVVSAWDGNG